MKEIGIIQKIRREIKRPFQQFRNWFLWELLGYHDIVSLIQRNATTLILHQKTFLNFKNIYQGQNVVIVACGPTAKEYKRIDNAIHIGVNRAFKIENINLDYLFIQDYGVKSYIKEANRYKPQNCTKFYGFLNSAQVIPESDVIEANALRYRTDHDPMYKRHKSKFSLFIDCEPLGDFCSVVFSAMQFALWTNPKTIYLVGCDCSEGYFDGQTSNPLSHLIAPWMLLYSSRLGIPLMRFYRGGIFV